MKLTRRQLVAATAGSITAAKVLAQAPPAATGAATHDFAAETRDAVQRNRNLLTRFEVPMSTEPAFQFKA
jgi:hypothetical protein